MLGNLLPRVVTLVIGKKGKLFMEYYKNKVVGWPYAICEKVEKDKFWLTVIVQKDKYEEKGRFKTKAEAEVLCKKLREQMKIPISAKDFMVDGYLSVTSKNIDFIGTDRNDLIVGYKGGGVYLYFKEAEQLMKIAEAESAGSYVNKHVRDLEFVQLW